MGFNEAKDIFANKDKYEKDIIKIFCAVKCLISWNSIKVGTICRERCGGAAFLKYNRINEAIEGGHSGATAEGDNRVLM
jgi:acyl-CoA oxidase